MPALALIAGLIGFLAMPAILVGLIKPHWVMPAAWRPTRSRAALLYLALSIAGVGIAGSMTPPSPETLARQEADAAEAQARKAAAEAAKMEEQQKAAAAKAESEARIAEAQARQAAAEAAKAEADARAAAEKQKAEAAKPVPTLNIPFDQAKAKFLPWVKQYKAVADTDRVMGNSNPDTLILTLTPHKGLLAKIEYTGIMEKGSPNNFAHFMRARQIMDYVAPEISSKDKDAALKDMAETLAEATDGGKPIEYMIGTRAKMRSFYAPAIGMWVFTIEAL